MYLLRYSVYLASSRIADSTRLKNISFLKINESFLLSFLAVFERSNQVAFLFYRFLILYNFRIIVVFNRIDLNEKIFLEQLVIIKLAQLACQAVRALLVVLIYYRCCY